MAQSLPIDSLPKVSEQVYRACLDLLNIHAFQSLDCPVPMRDQLCGHDFGKPVVPDACRTMDFALADGRLEPCGHTKANKNAAVAAVEMLSSCHAGPPFRSGLAGGRGGNTESVRKSVPYETMERVMVFFLGAEENANSP